MNWRDALDREVDSLAAMLHEKGGRAEMAAQEVREYAAAQAERLSELTADPGFARAGQNAAVNVAGFAALKAVEVGDELDRAARDAWVSGMASALRITAAIIAGA